MNEKIQADRIRRVLTLMQAQKVDAVLISNCSVGNWNTWLLAEEEIPLHLPYNRNNLCLIDAAGTVTQFCAREPHPTDWKKFPVITRTDTAEALRGKRLGLVNPMYLKRNVRDYLQNADVSLTDISDAFHLLKAEKTQEETDGLSRAVAGFETVFRTVPLLLTGEPLEREVVVRLRNRLRETGSDCEDLGTSFAVSLTSAPMDAPAVTGPILYPGRRVTWGDRINLCVNGFMPGGFASALGRCYVIGQPTPETEHLWSLAVDAQDLVAVSAKPGVTIRSLMQLLQKELLKPNGLPVSEENQIYGIGVSLYEQPRNIDSTRDLPLQEGMTLVIAPRIHPPAADPYCCMDVFQVTSEGAVRLGKLPRALCVLD